MVSTPQEPASTAASATPAPHTPRRGRPTAGQVEAIDRAIVDAAHAMFLADGFDTVGMKQVAEKAQVSKGTLYARYASKEDLFVAVIEASVRRWSDEAARFDAQLTDDIEQRLRHHATTIATWMVRPDVRALQRLVFSIRDRFPHLAETMRDQGYDYIVELITRDIRDAAERTGRPVRDPGAVARILVGSLGGVDLQEGQDRIRPRQLKDFAQRVVDVIVAGINAW